MSNYHVMELNDKTDQARIAFHVAVPDESNSAGINLRTAIVEHLSPSSTVPFILPADQAQIQAGEIYEHVETVQFDAHLTVPDKSTIIDNRFIELNAVIPDKIRQRYRFWGLSRDVA